MQLIPIIEGIVERDPMDDRRRIRVVLEDNTQVLVDPQELLATLEGKEVRLTLASLENLQKLQEMLEGSGELPVQGITAEEILA